MLRMVELPPRLATRRQQYENVLRQDCCAYCGARPAGTVDHVVPRCRIVEHEGPRNLVGACVECNLRKADRSLLLFLLHRAR